MTDVTFKQLVELLSNPDKACPGLSGNLYELARNLPHSCMNLSHNITPLDLFHAFSAELARWPWLYCRPISKEETQYMPQIIDALFEEDFSKEFRRLCKNIHIDPPYLKKKYDMGDDTMYFPEEIHFVLDFLGNILSHISDYSNVGLPFVDIILPINKKISPEQVEIFKASLGTILTNEVYSRGKCDLTIELRNSDTLSKAATMAGIIFPLKICIHITN